MKDLLRTADLSPDGLRTLLDLAAAYKADPHRGRTMLAGDSVVLYFAKPSTRTRISFETAVGRLGATPVVVGPAELQLGRGETIEDTARVISRFARAFVIRTFADADVAAFARAATIPVVNALTDGHHPCQSLADLLTLREAFGRLAGRKLAYLGDGNNVAHSLLEAGALAGMHVAVGTPPGYEPAPEVVERARAVAVDGAYVEITADPAAAVDGADAVYADVWLSMGDPDVERAARLRALEPYRVTAEVMALAQPHAVFLHCLPAHRGEEVSAEVIDGRWSRVFDQAENRLHTSVALLDALVGGAFA
jgi:ornithine carbamoyltransferase